MITMIMIITVVPLFDKLKAKHYKMIMIGDT